MEKLKQLVSQDLKRFQDGNYDLDLTYITPSLIAMGFPAQGVEGYFRNNIIDIARYLNERHKNHFMVFNLSAERSYDPELMQRRVIHMGFPDHHAPPLTLLFKILLRVHGYLKEDDENVACIHCLAGRGRTGCVIVSYLIYSTMLPNVMEAFDFYAQRRSNRLQGVSQPSQRRYCMYIDDILRRKNEDVRIFNPRPRALLLTRIRFGPVPSVSSQGGLRPLIYMYNYTNAGEDVLHVTETERDKAKHFIGGAKTVILDVTEKTSRPILLCGDIVFKMSHISTLLGVTKYDELIRHIFNTGMEVQKQQEANDLMSAEQRAKMKLAPDENVLVFRKSDLDVAYKDNRFLENFRIEFVYKLLSEVPEVEAQNKNLWDEELYQTFVNTNRSIELEKKLDYERKSAQSKLGLSTGSLPPYSPPSPSPLSSSQGIPSNSSSSTNSPNISSNPNVNMNSTVNNANSGGAWVAKSPSQPVQGLPVVSSPSLGAPPPPVGLSPAYQSNYLDHQPALTKKDSQNGNLAVNNSIATTAIQVNPIIAGDWEIVQRESKPNSQPQSSNTVLFPGNQTDSSRVNMSPPSHADADNSASLKSNWVAVPSSSAKPGGSRVRSTAFVSGAAKKTDGPASPRDDPPYLSTPNVALNSTSILESDVPPPSSPPQEPQVLSPRSAAVKETKPIDPLENMRY